MDLDDDEVLRVVKMDNAPRATLLNSKKFKTYMVRDLTRFVATELEVTSARDMESTLDRAVKAKGGRRVRVLDPYAAVARAVRAVARRPSATAHSEDVYELPVEALE